MLQTLVAEIYGPDYERQLELQRKSERFERTEGIADVDSYVEDDQVKYEIVVDQESRVEWRLRRPG